MSALSKSIAAAGNQVPTPSIWRRSPFITMLALLVIALASGGCKPRSTGSGYHPAGFPANVTAYDVAGVVEEIRAGGWKAVIAHEDIPGYMEAMSMLLDVKDTNELAGLQAGDTIRFRMLVTDNDGWIDRVRKTGATNLAPRPAPAPAVVELEPGDLLPDCLLTNQLGRPFHLSELRGQIVALTFIFVRCPFPTYCPRMNNNLGEAQKALIASGITNHWQLLSISFDPAHDTPEKLLSYAQTYHYDPNHWTFAVGSDEDVRRLGAGVGLAFSREGTTISHNVRTVLVNRAGRIHKVFAGNEWKPEELIAEMQQLLRTE